MNKKIIVILLALSVLFASCGMKDDLDDVESTEGKITESESAEVSSPETKPVESDPIESEPAESTPEENEPTECEHTVVVDQAVAATCTATGLSEGSHCSACGEVLTVQQIVPMIDHTATADEGEAPTCVENGLTDGSHCSVCGHIIEAQQTIPAPGHTYDDEYDATCNSCDHVRDVECKHENTETLPATPATCKKTGLTEGKICIDCGDILVAQDTTSVIEHTEETIDGVAPTCEKEGLTEGKKCSECGDILEAQESIPMLEHTYDDKYDDTCNACGGGKRPVETKPSKKPTVENGVIQLPIDPF